jgi:LysM repeat protein
MPVEVVFISSERMVTLGPLARDMPEAGISTSPRKRGRIRHSSRVSSRVWRPWVMQSRRWGLVFVVALIMAAALLGIALIRQPGPEGSPVTPDVVEETDLSPSPSPSIVPMQTGPVTYTVQSGDTLSAIAQAHDVSVETLTIANDLADPNFLRIGQVLIIPQEEPEDAEELASIGTPAGGSSAGARVNPQLPTLTPSGPPLVEISETVGVGDLEAETIVLSNAGGIVSLEAWTLASSSGDSFVLPALTLFTDGEVRVHSAEGDDTPRDLYWGRTEPVWQKGELVTLRDAAGNVVDTYIVPGP